MENILHDFNEKVISLMVEFLKNSIILSIFCFTLSIVNIVSYKGNIRLIFSMLFIKKYLCYIISTL